ncbi:hypothetical protein [Bartonella sp. B39]
MTRVFKNYVLNIFIVIVFFLSQVMSINANHLRNSHKKEEVAGFLMKQAGNTISKAVTMTALHDSTFGYEVENGIPTEGKIEKVVEPVTLSLFGVGVLTGYAASAAGMLLGWIIGKIVEAVKFAA